MTLAKPLSTLTLLISAALVASGVSAEEMLKLEVTIKKIDAFTANITLERNNAIREFPLASGAKIELNGKPVKLNDIKPGAKATILFDRASKSIASILVGETSKEGIDDPFDGVEREVPRRLFNGRDLAGWQSVGPNGWSVEGNVLVGETTGSPGWLMSDDEFEDFELEFEYSLSSESSSGVFLRAWREGDIRGRNFSEIQLLDNTASKYKEVSATSRNASLFKYIAADPMLNPAPDEWHRMKIALLGDELRVWVKDQKVVSGKLPAGGPKRGKIGFQLPGGRIKLRDIQVTKLTKPESES